MSRTLSRTLGRLLGIAGIFALTLALAPDTDAAGPRWRYGIGVATQNIVCGETTVRLSDIPGYRPGDTPWNPMGLGWRFNWSWDPGDPVPGVEYMPLVGGYRPGVNPSIAAIQTRHNNNPGMYPDGTVWLIGNEIIWDDERTPAQYAQDYHDFYVGLKSINPTWKVANGSVITSVQYNRPQWSGSPWELLDAVWDEYQTLYGEDWPVDVWNIHPYVWTQPTLQDELNSLQSQLNTMRNWMQNKGQQDKPLIITEYGLLNYHDWDHMIDYLYGSFEFLESEGHSNGMPSDSGRWVQRWAWFVMNNHVWECDGPVQWDHCCLYDAHDWSLTPLGEAFMFHAGMASDASGWMLYR